MSTDPPPPSAFHTTSIDAETPLRALAQRRDIPRALMEASDAFLSHGPSPSLSLLEAAASQDLPSVLTALLALDAAVRVDGQWQPIIGWLREEGGLVLDEDGEIQRLRMAAPIAPRSGDHSSSYREAIADGALVGVAAGFVLLAKEGPIASAHVAICGAATHPIRARQVEATLRGRHPSEELIQLAAETAAQEAQPFGVGTVLDPTVLLAIRDVTREVLTASLLEEMEH